MNQEREKLLEIFENNTYWINDSLPNGGRLQKGSGPVKYLKKDETGRITFSCGDWSWEIKANDKLEISDQCVIVYYTAPSGLKWVSVYGPIAAQDEVVQTMNGIIASY